jgi:hypothetical protein
MSFPAKFGGTCSKCAGRIPAGAFVNYDGRAIRHAPRCPAKGTVTEVAAPTPRQDESLTDDSKILGRAAYKGKSGYLVLWHGVTKEGKRATKLAFRDGTKTFWGNGDVVIEKMYDEPITFGKLNRLAKEFAAEKAQTKTGAATVDALRSQGVSLKESEEEGKNSVRVGQIIERRAKDGTVTRTEVVAVGAPVYTSREEASDWEDDMDMREGSVPHGWSTPYTYRVIESTPEQIAADRAAHEAREQAKAVQSAQLALAKLCEYGVSPEWVHDGRSGRIKPEIEAEIGAIQEQIWSGKFGAAAYRTAVGVLTYTPHYDDDPTYSLSRYTVMTPEQAEAVRAAAVIA